MFEQFNLQPANSLHQDNQINPGLTTQLRQLEAAMELDESLVLYGAPTLLGLKCASLYTCSYTQKTQEELGNLEPKVMFRYEFEAELEDLQKRLAPYGLAFDVIAWRLHGALLMVYRPALLTQALQDPLAKTRLAGLGYNPDDPDQAIALLKERMREFDTLTRPHDFWDFPHEVGHFLGYPAEDVEAYTRSRAHGFHCKSRRGVWFVYGDKAHMDECAQRFNMLNAATYYAYTQQSEGVTLEALAAMGQVVEGSV